MATTTNAQASSSNSSGYRHARTRPAPTPVAGADRLLSGSTAVPSTPAVPLVAASDAGARTPSVSTTSSSDPSTTAPILRSALRSSKPPPATNAAPKRARQRPNTSTDLSQNWLTTTAAPRFSRAGLEGVVMPVRAPERPTSVVEVEGWGEAVLIHRYGEVLREEEQGEDEDREEQQEQMKAKEGVKRRDSQLKKLGRMLSLSGIRKGRRSVGVVGGERVGGGDGVGNSEMNTTGNGWRGLFRRHV